MAVIDSRQRKSLATIRVSLTPSTPSADTTRHPDAATVRNERRLRKTPEFGTRRLDLAPSGPRNTLRTCPLLHRTPACRTTPTSPAPYTPAQLPLTSSAHSSPRTLPHTRLS